MDEILKMMSGKSEKIPGSDLRFSRKRIRDNVPDLPIFQNTAKRLKLAHDIAYHSKSLK